MTPVRPLYRRPKWSVPLIARVSRWPDWDDTLTPDAREAQEFEWEDRFDLLTELKLQQEGL